MQYTIEAAESDLSRLITEAQAGADVTIVRGEEPVARLVPVSAEVDVPPEPRREFKFGIWKDLFKEPLPDFFEPMDEEELRLWEGGE